MYEGAAFATTGASGFFAFGLGDNVITVSFLSQFLQDNVHLSANTGYFASYFSNYLCKSRLLCNFAMCRWVYSYFTFHTQRYKKICSSASFFTLISLAFNHLHLILSIFTITQIDAEPFLLWHKKYQTLRQTQSL